MGILNGIFYFLVGLFGVPLIWLAVGILTAVAAKLFKTEKTVAIEMVLTVVLWPLVWYDFYRYLRS